MCSFNDAGVSSTLTLECSQAGSWIIQGLKEPSALICEESCNETTKKFAILAFNVFKQNFFSLSFYVFEGCINLMHTSNISALLKTRKLKHFWRIRDPDHEHES